MYRIIIILLVYTGNFYAQKLNLKDLVYWEHKIYENPNNLDSVIQFQLNKIKIYLSNNIYDQNVISEFKNINWNSIKDSIQKNKYLYNLAVLYYLNNQADYAYFYLEQYYKKTQDYSFNNKIFNTLIASNLDSTSFYSNFNDLIAIDSLKYLPFLNLFLINNQTLPQKKAYIFSSYVIPGLGTMLQGDIFNGLGSLTFNSLAIYSTYLLASSNLYINAVGWGILLIPRFYGGNIELTKKTIHNNYKKRLHKMSEENKKFIDDILKEFPIELKLF